MSTVNSGPNISKQGLVLCLDAGNNKSYSVNRFQSYGTGLVTENVTFAINGTGTFQRVAAGTVIGGYTVKPNDVVYSYALGGTGCHYHGNGAQILAGSYATFSFDYLVTGATTYPINDYLANFEGVASGAIATANSLQNIWQRRSFTSSIVSTTGNMNMYLYPGACGGGRLADSGTIYYRNPKVEITTTDTGNSTFSASNSITTWYDISGNGYNGTLTNGPTSNVSNGGSIVFDGSNDYSTYTPTPTVLQGNPNLTVMGFYKRTASFNDKGFWGIGGSIAGGIRQGICNWNSTNTNEITIDSWAESTFTTGQTYPLNTWIGVAWRKLAGPMTRANCTISIFNGSSLTHYTSTALTVLRSESSTNLNINSIGGLTVGSISVDTGYCSPINVGCHYVYNRFLNDSEISSNFQTIRNRFGL